MNKNIHQTDVDTVIMFMIIDAEILEQESKIHGTCLRLFCHKNYREWLFLDKYKLKIET